MAFGQSQIVDFNSIVFGKTSAEAEKEEYPQLLIDGFIDSSKIVDRLLNKNTFLVYGQKGSGKTAIGSRMCLMYENSEEANVKLMSLDDFEYGKLAGYDSNKGIKDNMMVRSWESILYIALLELLDSDQSIKFKNRTSEKVISDLKKYEIIPAGSIDTIMKRTSKKRMVNLKLFKEEKEESHNEEVSYDRMHDNLKNALINCIPSKKHMIIIDGLDSIMSDSQKQIKILSYLLRAVDNINKLLRTEKVTAKIILFCRTDILDKISDPNKQKIIDDYGYCINWAENIPDVNQVSLIKLINLRAKLSLGDDAVDVFKEFPKNINGKEIHKYILDHTRHIPRDIVRLMNEIQHHNNGKITQEVLIKSIRGYSADYFMGEIKDEMKGFVNDEDIDRIFQLMGYIGKYEFPEQELKQLAKERNLNLDFEKILTVMFNAGAIGNVRHLDNGSKEYSFKYRDRHAQYNPYTPMIVHLALQNALKVAGSSMKILDED